MSRFKFQLTVASAPLAVPAEAGNTVYLIDQYGFADPGCHDKAGSRLCGGAITPDRAGVNNGSLEPL
jgi:hypothetical protein